MTPRLMIQTRFRRPEITAGGAGIRRAFRNGDVVCWRRRDALRAGSQWWTPVQCSHEDTLQHRPQGGQQCQQQPNNQWHLQTVSTMFQLVFFIRYWNITLYYNLLYNGKYHQKGDRNFYFWDHKDKNTFSNNQWVFLCSFVSWNFANNWTEPL